ncbi:MAG: hypothetical protein AABX13_00100 [Nanoarchaeota archaeon]
MSEKEKKSLDEITFKVSRQADGWYLAAPLHDRIGGATEASDYETLKEKVPEFVRGSLRDEFHREAGLSPNPQIRLIYTEFLCNNPAVEKILVRGYFEQGSGYGVHDDLYFQFDLHHRSFDALREMLLKVIQQQGYHNQHIEFHLEEVIRSDARYESRRSA